MSISPSTRRRLGQHLLFWLAVTIALSMALINMVADLVEDVQFALMSLPFHLVVTYTGLYWVLPPALEERFRPFVNRLVVFLIGSFVLNFLFRAFVLVPFREGRKALNPAYHEIFALGIWRMGLLIAGVAIGIKLYRFWYQRERANQLLVRETLTVELQVLKAQIHPHFLFNTLNNLYSLTLTQSPQAPDIVLKLSGLLHYMIYECSESIVPLAKEVAFLRNYIELEKLRYGPRLVVSIDISGEMNSTFMAPLLLIPFVENAFKHGSARQISAAQIKLVLRVAENRLTFHLDNSRDAETLYDDSTPNGLGLLNVRKRLDLLYQNNYTLRITPEAGRFLVDMTIDFTKE